MYKFLFKTSFFVIPFIGLYFFTLKFYNITGSDLIRMGYLPDFYTNTKRLLEKENETIKFYDDFYFDNIKKKYDYLIIGDSFSDGIHTFSNKIAKKSKLLILNGRFDQNPIQRLFSLVNTGFFDSIQVKNVILESVERLSIERADYLLLNDSLRHLPKKENNNTIFKKPEFLFFSNQSLIFGYNSLKYFLFNNGDFNTTVKMFPLSKPLFTHYRNKTILVLSQDIEKTSYNNKLKNLLRFNKIMNIINNKLIKYNTRFHVMICPDKYDLYFDFFLNKHLYERPLLFNKLENLKHDYNLLPIRDVLLNQLNKGSKDLYLYDDTHWSSRCTKIVSNYLFESISFK